MNSHRHIKAFLAAAIVAVVGLTACGSEDMLLSYQHTVQVGVASMRTKNDTTLLEVSAYGIGRYDTVYSASSTSELYLNLNLNADSTAYKITTHGTLDDEMYFYYTKKLEPVSGSGGIAVELHLDSVKYTTVFIDSMSIEEPYIRYNESLTNVKIYIY